ncbi:MAG: hypothetical protein F4233_01210 [Rhodospirillaceae bacterium]|nr:hypothetical protein [Rhodospirillaceae bacterium]
MMRRVNYSMLVVAFLACSLNPAFSQDCNIQPSSGSIYTNFARLSWKSEVVQLADRDRAEALHSIENTGTVAVALHWRKPGLLVVSTSPLEQQCTAFVRDYAHNTCSFQRDYSAPIHVNRRSNSYSAIAVVKQSDASSTGGGVQIICRNENVVAVEISFLVQENNLSLLISADPFDVRVGLSMDDFSLEEDEIRRVTDGAEIAVGTLDELMSQQPQYNLTRQALVTAFGQQILQVRFFVLRDRRSFRLPLRIGSDTQIASPLFLFDRNGILKIASLIQYAP